MNIYDPTVMNDPLLQTPNNTATSERTKPRRGIMATFSNIGSNLTGFIEKATSFTTSLQGLGKEKETEAAQKDNTLLYAGGAIVAILIIVAIIYYARKK